MAGKEYVTNTQEDYMVTPVKSSSMGKSVMVEFVLFPHHVKIARKYFTLKVM